MVSFNKPDLCCCQLDNGLCPALPEIETQCQKEQTKNSFKALCHEAKNHKL